jgi:hypothetical protein
MEGKDNVIISLCNLNERDDTEHVGVVELAVYKHGEHEGEALVWNLYVEEEGSVRIIGGWKKDTMKQMYNIAQ